MKQSEQEIVFTAALLLAGPEPELWLESIAEWKSWRDVVEDILVYEYRDKWWYKPEERLLFDQSVDPDEYKHAMYTYASNRKKLWDAFNTWLKKNGGEETEITTTLGKLTISPRS